MATSADRNLLFGILALQMDFVTREQLVAGMQAWLLTKQQPLAEHLVRIGALRPTHQQLLDPLVEEHIRQHNNDPQQSLAAISSAGSLPTQLEGLGDEQLQASLGFVRGRAHRHPFDECATVSLPPPAANGNTIRFRILRPHASGGIGEVFVARDEELNREVALKQIQQQHAGDPDSRERFLREAEITGNLEHPGIVPVYGLGAYDDGRAFYAMRFIRGDNLKQAVDQFHAEGKQRIARMTRQQRDERIVRLRNLLRRFIDVCNAVAYAHSRGVLHRDLKPGNIMLGKYGETLIVDWGLAKSAERGNLDRNETSEKSFHLQSGSNYEPTAFGATIGTPAYMSPEQAAGRHDELGVASDVYSLGATLFYLLTGQPPIQGANREEVLDRARRGALDRPRNINKRLPRALEAICLKALALNATDRYATAEKLGDDVQRWLDDVPISADPESTLAKAWRQFNRDAHLYSGWLILFGSLIYCAYLVLTTINLALDGRLFYTGDYFDWAMGLMLAGYFLLGVLGYRCGRGVLRKERTALWFAEVVFGLYVALFLCLTALGKLDLDDGGGPIVTTLFAFLFTSGFIANTIAMHRIYADEWRS